MRFERRFTQAGKSPFERMAFRAANSEIRNPDGTIVFRQTGIDVPADWSQVAADVLAQKYFRRAGVARASGQGRREPTCRSGCGARRPTKQPSAPLPEDQRFGGETQRAAGFPSHGRRLDLLGLEGRLLRQRGRRPDLLRRALLHAGRADVRAELAAMVQYRPALGLRHRRSRARVIGTSTIATARSHPSSSSYERPQPHACFIQSVSDDLVNEGGIMDLWVREARLFKYGSGTGSNFSALRGADEKLSGGGKSSGLMSFLKIGDRAAGAIKSGGTTRRAAKMVDGRHRPSGHRGVHLLEDAGGAEGGGAGRRLPSRQPAPQRHHGAPAPTASIPRKIRGCAARSWPPAGPSCRRTTSSASSSSPRRAIATSNSRPSTPIGSRKPMRRSRARTPTTRCA